MRGKRKPAEMVQSFVGHVPEDDSEEILDTLEPIRLPEMSELFQTQLTPKVCHAMALSVAAGNTIPVAASEIGVPFNVWKHWGPNAKRDQQAGKEPGWEDGQSPYLVWAAYMMQAKAQFEASSVKAIRKHGNNDWKALAWLIERRFPDRWTVKKQQTVSPLNEKDAATLAAQNMSTEELRKALGAGDGDED